MFRRRSALLAAIAVAIALFGVVGSAGAGGLVCPAGTNNSLLKGTYNYNFFGSVQNQSGNLPVAGTGSFVADGLGHLSATGVAHCNLITEISSTVTGGCYAVNADGTGTMTITTSSQFCLSSDSGVDLLIAVSGTNGQVSFSSNGAEPNFNTGHFIVYSGLANKTSH